MTQTCIQIAVEIVDMAEVRFGDRHIETEVLNDLFRFGVVVACQEQRPTHQLGIVSGQQLAAAVWVLRGSPVWTAHSHL